MRATILLINFQDRDRVAKIQRAALPLRLAVRQVPREDYLQPAGYLAGDKSVSARFADASKGRERGQEISGSDGCEPNADLQKSGGSEPNVDLSKSAGSKSSPELLKYDGPELDDEMILMAGLDSRDMDLFLTAMRRQGLGRIDYKAMLTETNKTWPMIDLYTEIKKEHEMMAQAVAARRAPERSE